MYLDSLPVPVFLMLPPALRRVRRESLILRIEHHFPGESLKGFALLRSCWRGRQHRHEDANIGRRTPTSVRLEKNSGLHHRKTSRRLRAGFVGWQNPGVFGLEERALSLGKNIFLRVKR